MNSGFCLGLSAGVALLILAAGAGRRWARAARWLSLALVGQAVALQLIDAGNRIHYQHYAIAANAQTAALLSFLALQTAAVVTGLWKRFAAMGRWAWSRFPRWQLAAILLVFVCSSAALSRQLSFFVAELLFAAFVQAVGLANIVLVAQAIPQEELGWLRQRIEQWFGPPGEPHVAEPGRIDRFAVVAAVWVTVAASCLSLFVYERHPHIADEVVYLYNARYFAQGQVAMPLPPVPRAFDVDLMDYQKTRWFAAVPMGWPAMLAVGVLAHAPWLVDPLLAGLNILLAYLFLREIYSRRTARFALLFLSVSPWHLFMAMNFMTHTFTMTCALLGFLGVARARRTGKARWAWMAGFGAGVGSFIRPLDGLIVAGLLGLWVIGIGGRRLRLTSIVAFGLGTILAGAAVLPYNRALTGDPTRSSLMAYTDKYYGPKTNAYGFGPQRGLGWALDPYPGHTPLESLLNAQLNAFSVNIELLGWSAGSLLLAAAILFSGALRRSDYLMLAVITAVFLAYALYWFSGGPDFGARYWYLILVPCVALTVRGMQLLENRVASSGGPDGLRVLPAVLVLCGMALINYFPWRSIDKYHDYLRMRPDIRQMASRFGFGRSLVLVRGPRYPDYASAAIYNPLNLNADEPVYAWDRNPEVRAEVLRAYADRPVWLVDGPSLTHGAFRLAAGPVSAQTLLHRDASTPVAGLTH